MSGAPSSDDAPEPIEIVHHHPGRLRLRARALRDTALGEAVTAALDAVSGITAITHNAHTGSLLIAYQPGLVSVEVLVAAVVKASGLGAPLDEREARARRGDPAENAIGAARRLNAIVRELTGGDADLRGIVPAAMAAAAVYSFATHDKDRFPRWDNLLYWSYNIFTQLHRREIDGAEPASKPGR